MYINIVRASLNFDKMNLRNAVDVPFREQDRRQNHVERPGQKNEGARENHEYNRQACGADNRFPVHEKEEARRQQEARRVRFIRGKKHSGWCFVVKALR